jgi:hypothetical protein
MSVTKMIHYIRSNGWRYVCIERYDNDDRDGWGIRAEKLNENVVTPDFWGINIESVVTRLYQWVKKTKGA